MNQNNIHKFLFFKRLEILFGWLSINPFGHYNVIFVLKRQSYDSVLSRNHNRIWCDVILLTETFVCYWKALKFNCKSTVLIIQCSMNENLRYFHGFKFSWMFMIKILRKWNLNIKQLELTHIPNWLDCQGATSFKTS